MPKTANKIVVIGGSAGALQALETLFARVPSELPATIFVVLHLASHLPSNLPRILSSLDGWVARNPMAEEKIEPGAVYVASPDRHMLIEKGRVKSVMGPKENRHRPAVNVLFRSAAYEYGGKVIGVVLSGSLDDGTSGLWEIKRRGGVAIVQDPTDAVHPWMPRSAIENADVDYVRPVAEIPELLVSLCSSEVSR